MYDRKKHNEEMKREVTTLTETCKKCSGIEVLRVATQDLHDWKNGELIQKALPYLTVDQRELLISGVCGPCFDGMFPDESEE